MVNVLEEFKGIVGDLLKPIIKPLAKAICEKILFPILEEKAKSTATPIDDLILANAKAAVLKAVDEMKV